MTTRNVASASPSPKFARLPCSLTMRIREIKDNRSTRMASESQRSDDEFLSTATHNASSHDVMRLAATSSPPPLGNQSRSPQTMKFSVCHTASRTKGTSTATKMSRFAQPGGYTVPGYLNLHNLIQRQPAAMITNARKLFVHGLSNRPPPRPSSAG